MTGMDRNYEPAFIKSMHIGVRNTPVQSYSPAHCHPERSSGVFPGRSEGSTGSEDCYFKSEILRQPNAKNALAFLPEGSRAGWMTRDSV